MLLFNYFPFHSHFIIIQSGPKSGPLKRCSSTSNEVDKNSHCTAWSKISLSGNFKNLKVSEVLFEQLGVVPLPRRPRLADELAEVVHLLHQRIEICRNGP